MLSRWLKPTVSDLTGRAVPGEFAPAAQEAGSGNVAGMTSREQPCYRTVFGVDVESSTMRNNSAKARMRDAVYTLVTEALVRAEIAADDHDPFLDTGDGLVVMLRSADRVPKTLLLRSVVPTLSRLVDEHNQHHPADHLRLRTVLHAGEMHFDTHAPFGETLDVAFRLLNSPVTKHALRGTTVSLVLAVSDDIYQSVVRHQYDGIDPLTFTAFVTKRNSTTWDTGWLQVPGQAGHSLLDRDS
jgi:hypothetical protein